MINVGTISRATRNLPESKRRWTDVCFKFFKFSLILKCTCTHEIGTGCEEVQGSRNVHYVRATDDISDAQATKRRDEFSNAIVGGNQPQGNLI